MKTRTPDYIQALRSGDFVTFISMGEFVKEKYTQYTSEIGGDDVRKLIRHELATGGVAINKNDVKQMSFIDRLVGEIGLSNYASAMYQDLNMVYGASAYYVYIAPPDTYTGAITDSSTFKAFLKKVKGIEDANQDKADKFVVPSSPDDEKKYNKFKEDNLASIMLSFYVLAKSYDERAIIESKRILEEAKKRLDTFEASHLDRVANNKKFELMKEQLATVLKDNRETLKQVIPDLDTVLAAWPVDEVDEARRKLNVIRLLNYVEEWLKLSQINQLPKDLYNFLSEIHKLRQEDYEYIELNNNIQGTTEEIESYEQQRLGAMADLNNYFEDASNKSHFLNQKNLQHSINDSFFTLLSKHVKADEIPQTLTHLFRKKDKAFQNEISENLKRYQAKNKKTVTEGQPSASPEKSKTGGVWNWIKNHKVAVIGGFLIGAAAVGAIVATGGLAAIPIAGAGIVAAVGTGTLATVGASIAAAITGGVVGSALMTVGAAIGTGLGELGSAIGLFPKKEKHIQSQSVEEKLDQPKKVDAPPVVQPASSGTKEAFVGLSHNSKKGAVSALKDNISSSHWEMTATSIYESLSNILRHRYWESLQNEADRKFIDNLRHAIYPSHENASWLPRIPSNESDKVKEHKANTINDVTAVITGLTGDFEDIHVSGLYILIRSIKEAADQHNSLTDVQMNDLKNRVEDQISQLATNIFREQALKELSNPNDLPQQRPTDTSGH